MAMMGSHRTAYKEQQAAMRLIEESRKNAFQQVFSGTTLEKNSKAIKDDVQSIGKETKGFASAVSKAAGSAVPGPVSEGFRALELVMTLVGIEEQERADFELVMAEELAVFAGGTLMNVAETFVPYLGTVVAGKDMVKEWMLTAKKGHQSYNMKRSIPTDILPGDPAAAAMAVRELISRSAANHGRIATINTVKFAVDVASSAAPGATTVAGPVTAAGAAGAKLANSLFLLGRDYHEMKCANALMKSGSLPDSAELFSAYPLLGCYLIIGANDSDLLFFLVEDMGSAGWMDKVEKQKKRTLGPLQKTARKTIEGSRFTLAGYNGNKLALPGSVKSASAKAHLKSFVHRVFL